MTNQIKTLVHQLCADTGCRLENSQREMLDRKSTGKTDIKEVEVNKHCEIAINIRLIYLFKQQNRHERQRQRQTDRQTETKSRESVLTATLMMVMHHF